MLGDAHGIVRLAQLERQPRQRPERRVPVHALAEVAEQPERQPVLARVVQQHRRAHLVRAQRRALRPVRQRRPGDLPVAARAQPGRRQLAVERGLVPRPGAVPLGCAVAVAQRLVGAPQPVAAAPEADRRLDHLVEALEMRDGAARVVQLPQRDPARQPFQLGIGGRVGRRHVMQPHQLVGRRAASQPRHAPGQRLAPPGPDGRDAQLVRIAGDPGQELRRRVVAVGAPQPAELGPVRRRRAARLRLLARHRRAARKGSLERLEPRPARMPPGEGPELGHRAGAGAQLLPEHEVADERIAALRRHPLGAGPVTALAELQRLGQHGAAGACGGEIEGAGGGWSDVKGGEKDGDQRKGAKGHRNITFCSRASARGSACGVCRYSC